MKFIFLDIDGVLNSNEYFGSERFIKEHASSNSLDMSLKIDPEKIKLLNNLVAKSGASVIISSAWRIIFSPEDLEKFLKSRGATFIVTGATPKFCEKYPATRGDEIQSYIDDCCFQSEGFIIIDDINDMSSLEDHLIQTNPEIGLTEENVERALNMLENC